MKKIDSLKKDIKEGAGIMTAVDVAIFNEKGEVLLGKRLASAGFGSWGFPGGHLKKDEKLAEGVKREIREELGDAVVIDLPNKILAVRENNLPPQRVHHLTVVLEGHYLEGEVKINEPDRCEKWEWFSLDSLPNKLFSGIAGALENYRKGTSGIVTDWEE